MLHVPFNVVNITSYNAAIVAYMHNVLHWLSISQRIQYHITATVSRCVLRCSPSYLCDLCCPVSVLATRWNSPLGHLVMIILFLNFRRLWLSQKMERCSDSVQRRLSFCWVLLCHWEDSLSTYSLIHILLVFLTVFSSFYMFHFFTLTFEKFLSNDVLLLDISDWPK